MYLTFKVLLKYIFAIFTFFTRKRIRSLINGPSISIISVFAHFIPAQQQERQQLKKPPVHQQESLQYTQQSCHQQSLQYSQQSYDDQTYSYQHNSQIHIIHIIAKSMQKVINSFSPPLCNSSNWSCTAHQ